MQDNEAMIKNQSRKIAS